MAPKSVLKPRPTGSTTRTETSQATDYQRSAREPTKRAEHGKKAADHSPVDYAKEDVVSWMSSHQRPSTAEFNDDFVSGSLVKSLRQHGRHTRTDRRVVRCCYNRFICNRTSPDCFRVYSAKKITRRPHTMRSSTSWKNWNPKIMTLVVNAPVHSL